MPKFSFDNSVYNKLWDSNEGRTLLTQIVNDPDLVGIKPHYFPTAFTVDPNPVPTNEKGKASFTVEAKYPEHSEMMDMRAPLGEGRLGEEGEISQYSGSIPDFIAPTWKEQAMERLYKQRMFEKYGDDAAIIQGFATDQVAPRIESGYQTLDNLALTVETTGKCYYNEGVGIKSPIYTADIPDANRIPAGAKAWADPDCELLTQMAEIEQYFKEDKWGVTFGMQWKFDEDFFKNVILKNKQVIDTIKMNWLADNGQLIDQTSSVPNSIVTEDAFNRYVVGRFPGISPIRIVKSRQISNGKVINPWPDGVAVYCPAGFAGRILRTEILDEEVYSLFGNKACDFSFARSLDGLMLVMNSVLPNGSLTEWQMKVMMSAVPVIEDYLYRVIVNTKTAGSIKK